MVGVLILFPALVALWKYTPLSSNGIVSRSVTLHTKRLFVIELEKLNAVFFLLGLADYLVSLEWSTTRCQAAKPLNNAFFLNFTY